MALRCANREKKSEGTNASNGQMAKWLSLIAIVCLCSFTPSFNQAMAPNVSLSALELARPFHTRLNAYPLHLLWLQNDATSSGSGDGDRDPEWVTLVSEDDFRFILDYRCAISSGTIKTMLSTSEGGGFAEAQSNTVSLQIRGEVLEKVIEYLMWKTKYSDASSTVDIPDFQNRIPPEIALELLMAADFLDGT